MEVARHIEEIRRSMGKDLLIMGHHYQSDLVIRHCDRTGDSLELASMIPHITARHIVFCGVSFMGESAALLTGEGQNVYLPEPDAHCMMALMATGMHAKSVLQHLRSKGREVLPLAYVNTSLDLKAEIGAFGGAVCTSANAETMLRWALEQCATVLFLPDKHLARNTAKRLGLSEEDWGMIPVTRDITTQGGLPEKRLLIWPGSCPLHGLITREHVLRARLRFPNATVLVHPECPPEVVEESDGAGSTSFLIREAERMAKEKDSQRRTLVIGTEANLVARLKERFKEDLDVEPLFPALCPDMNAITEQNLLATLRAVQEGRASALHVARDKAGLARKSLERMFSVLAAKG
ncbi:MAG: quinolinate synthase NadA [Desulfovibrio sp.]|nr:quinolinate synthase NadA [Desulfovibrio sp.]